MQLKKKYLFFGILFEICEEVKRKAVPHNKARFNINSLIIIIMAVEKTVGSSSLVEVVDRILDKGVVVDAWVRVSLVGIELVAIEARIVVASVETYLKYAEAIGLTAKAA
jgi:hypothetical protein